MAHTPGPWDVEYGENGGAIEVFAPLSDKTKPGGLGTIVRRRGIAMPTSHEGIANARLIAAAPDLLAACKGLISNHEALCAKAIDAGVLPHPDPEGPYMLAKAAVEKAEPGWVPPDDEPDEDDTAIYTETGGES